MKPAARLTASLLARKGQAKPAMGPRSTAHLAPHEPGHHHADPLAGMTAPQINPEIDPSIDPSAGFGDNPDIDNPAIDPDMASDIDSGIDSGIDSDMDSGTNGERPDAAQVSHPALPGPMTEDGAEDGTEDAAPRGNPEADVIERALQRGRAHAEEGDIDDYGEPTPPAEAPVAPPMHAAAPATGPRHDRRPVGSGARIAMTVRLDHERHHRLRVLSAHLNKSSQEILVEALDKFLDKRTPEAADHGCTCLDQADASTDTENNAGESPSALGSGGEG